MTTVEIRELAEDDDLAWAAELMTERRERYAEYSLVLASAARNHRAPSAISRPPGAGCGRRDADGWTVASEWYVGQPVRGSG